MKFKFFSRQITPLITVITFFACVSPCDASTVVSTLGNDVASADSVAVGFSTASHFITSANPGGWTVTGASIELQYVNNSGGNFFLSIYDDDGGKPGSVVGVFSGTSNPSAGINDYTSPGISLSSETSYWLWAGVSAGSGEYGWAYADQTFSQTGIWSIPTIDTYIYFTGGVWDGPHNGYPYKFSLEASPVPEIATSGYAGAAALTVGFLSLLKRRRMKVKLAA